MLTSPTVTVVIPCYNYGKYLPDAVSSSLDQTGVQPDVVIVDDASTDGSAVTARKLTRSTDRVRLVEHVHNMGHIATYNEGLASVSSEYVVLLSADDLLSPGSLQRSLALLEAHPEVGLCYGHAVEFQDLPPGDVRTSPRSWSVWPAQEWVAECCRQGKNFVFTPSVVMRRSVLEEVGGYRADMPHAADFFLWMQSNIAYGVGRVNGCDQAFYRLHGQNMHLTMFAGALTDLRERRSAFEELFVAEGQRLGGRSAPLQARVARALSREASQLALRTLDAETWDGRSPRHSLALAEEYAGLARELQGEGASAWPARRYRRSAARAAQGLSPTAGQHAREALRQFEDKVSWRIWKWSGV